MGLDVVVVVTAFALVPRHRSRFSPPVPSN
jgi:hypothetical protein